MDVTQEVTATLRAEAHHPPVVMEELAAAGFCTEHSAKARGIGYEAETAPTLRAGVVPAAIALDNHPTDSRVKLAEDDEIAALVQMPEETTPEAEGSEASLPTEDTTAEEPAAVLLSVDFTALREAAPNVIGWLMQGDTAINYPITQTEDNDYYLTHLYDGTYNKAGCLFSDYENRTDFSDRSTIVYGHNMRDGSMFASLNQYRKQSYYEAHPTMILLTPEGGYVVELFAAFNASPKESGKNDSPWRLDFENDADFTVWLSAMTSRSLIQTETAVTARDKVLTLSTCNGSGDRFIVMGKLNAVN